VKHSIGITLALIAFLGAIFLKGFKEAIGLALLLVFAYLALNVVVITFGLYEVVSHPFHIPEWRTAMVKPSKCPRQFVVDCWSVTNSFSETCPRFVWF
jgi:hypothetical protein